MGIITGILLLFDQERREAGQNWLGSCLENEVQLVTLGLGFLLYLLCRGW